MINCISALFILHKGFNSKDVNSVLLTPVAFSLVGLTVEEALQLASQHVRADDDTIVLLQYDLKSQTAFTDIVINGDLYNVENN